jgi:hypothetical protein
MSDWESIQNDVMLDARAEMEVFDAASTESALTR